MTSSQFYSLLRQQFPFQPTVKQDIFFQQIAVFLTNNTKEELFVLKGYAGTGKTTVISTIVNNLVEVNKKYVLLAPTGRAAKVIANYSNKPAFTIHKKIYFPKKASGGGVSFTMQTNKHKNTIFIVDESSMISDVNTEAKLYENGSLLDDLMSYVYNGENCKLILLGDTAQLPPVQMEVSPALDTNALSMHYNKEVFSIKSINSTFYFKFVDKGTIYITPRNITNKTIGKDNVQKALSKLYDVWIDYQIDREFEVIKPKYGI